MIGYIFKAENTVNKKVYIGKRYSVRFDKKYVGNAPEVVSDVERYGIDKFIVNMIKACETVKDCDLAYDAILNELHAKTDKNFYNCEFEEVAVTDDDTPVKKSRRKKVKDA